MFVAQTGARQDHGCQSGVGNVKRHTGWDQLRGAWGQGDGVFRHGTQIHAG